MIYLQVSSINLLQCIDASYLVPVAISEAIISVSCGYRHTIALTINNNLFSWGYNEFGQLGTNDYKSYSLPQKIMSDVKMISCGANHNIIVKTNNEIWGWGSNDHNQLLNKTKKKIPKPTRIII